jgi:hypothetical protein
MYRDVVKCGVGMVISERLKDPLTSTTLPSTMAQLGMPMAATNLRTASDWEIKIHG